MTGAVRSVSSRLTGAFTTLVVLLVLVTGTGVAGMAVTGTSRDREVRLDQLHEANTGMLLAMANAETGVRGYRLAQDRTFLEPYEQGRRAFPRVAGRALDLAHGPRERALVRRQVALAHQWLTTSAEPVVAMPPGRVVVSDAMTRRNKATFDALRAANADLGALIGSRRRAAAADERWARTGSVTATALGLALALAVALVTGRRTRRTLVDPLDDLVGVLTRRTAGDWTVRADERRGPVEVRAVARTVNALSDEGDRMRGEAAEAARTQRLAARIGRSIRDHLDADDSLGAAVSQLGVALGADQVWVRLLEEGGLGSVQKEWHRPGLTGVSGAAEAAATAGSGAWVQDLHRRGEHLAVPDLLAASQDDPVYDAYRRRTGASAVLIVPIGAGDSAVGALTVCTRSGPRDWTADDQVLAASVAADLGRALVLARLYQQQQQLVERLRALDRTKTDFVATVSHELRTPLTSISGYLELLREGEAGELPGPAEAMLAVVERNARRLEVLIEDLLTLSSIESGTFRVSRAEVAVDDLVTAVTGVMAPMAHAGGLDLQVRPGPPGPLVWGDALQLERALAGLLSNALKFTPAGGRVVVRAAVEGSCVVLEVTDSGIGVPEDEQGGLYDRFFRATNAVELAIPGTGLGLTIVRSIVEHHGGELSITSREGEGTTARLVLPLLEVPTAAGADAGAAGAGAGAAAPEPVPAP